MTATAAEVLTRHADRSQDCWLWTAYRDKDGYGKAKVARRTFRAHRLAYETWVGPIPDGLTIDHLCGEKACLNPAHLEAVPIAVNVRRANLRMTYLGPTIPGDKCHVGHAFTPENTRVRPNGTRACRACHRERVNRSNHAKKRTA